MLSLLHYQLKNLSLLCLAGCMVAGLLLSSTNISYAQEMEGRKKRRMQNKIPQNAPVQEQPKGETLLRGKVLDKTTGETLIGITIILKGTTYGTNTNFDGVYEFRGLPAGSYTIEATGVSFKPLVINDVQVKGGRTNTLDMVMVSEDVVLEAVVIETRQSASADAALLAVQRNALQISDGYSGDMILRESPDFNATTILRRMPGIALLEDRYVVLRGAPERYNTFMLNSSLLPATDLERASFDYTTLPTNLISAVRVLKSPAADAVAEMGGGLIQLQTQDIPDRTGLRAFYQIGYNTEATFQNFKGYKATENRFGILPEVKIVPDNFPPTSQISEAPLQSPLRTQAAASLNAQPRAEEFTALPNQSVGLTYQRVFKIGKNQAGFTTFANFQDLYNQVRQDNVTVLPYNKALKRSPVSENIAVNKYTHHRSLNGLFNVGMELGKAGKLSWRNLLSYTSDNDAADQNVSLVNPFLDGRKINYYMNPQRFISRSLYNTELQADYTLYRADGENERLRLSGKLNATFLNTEDPGYRALVYLQDTLTGRYEFRDGGFYSRMLTASRQDRVVGGDFKAETPLIRGTDIRLNATAGMFFNAKWGQYRSRLLSVYFAYDSSAKPINRLPTDALYLENSANIFAPQNFGDGGFTLYEATGNFDNYDSRSINTAPYGQLDLRIKRALRLTGGFRVETFRQIVDIRPTAPGFQDLRLVNTVMYDILPSLNSTWSVTPRANLRFSYGQSLNRPLDRELVPLMYFNINYGTRNLGNPNLTRSLIHNYDLRYEFFASGTELMSISVFYKNILNPIEQVITQTSIGGAQLFDLRNQKTAEIGGIELELRRKLSAILTTSPWAENFTLYGNLTLLRSRINTTSIDQLFRSGRALQGQADYLINAGIIFREPKTRSSFALFYNRVGKRISAVGSGATTFPSFYELPRDLIDIQVTKEIATNWEIRLSVADMLNQPVRWVQIYDDSNRYDPNRDQTIRRIRYGLNTYFTLTYKF